MTRIKPAGFSIDGGAGFIAPMSTSDFNFDGAQASRFQAGGAT